MANVQPAPTHGPTPLGREPDSASFRTMYQHSLPEALSPMVAQKGEKPAYIEKTRSYSSERLPETIGAEVAASGLLAGWQSLKWGK